MPRGYGEVRAELHHFSDALETDSGVESYFPLIDGSGNISCNLLLTKTRLAPTQQIKIPRFELSAATMSVVVDKYIESELDIGIKQPTNWTDSCIVQQYIINDNL